MIDNFTSCPCQSGRPYSQCCGPLLSGECAAPTAEALMRSRYTAFAVRDVVHLLRSWHPLTRPAAIDPDTIPEWHGLRIMRTEEGREGDSKGVVEFEATFSAGQGRGLLREASRFVREDGQWFYVDGDHQESAVAASKKETKTGRNDPCPCGSGRKFKKCCGG
jgi:SEC-C motif-containing protein